MNTKQKILQLLNTLSQRYPNYPISSFYTLAAAEMHYSSTDLSDETLLEGLTKIRRMDTGLAKSLLMTSCI